MSSMGPKPMDSINWIVIRAWNHRGSKRRTIPKHSLPSTSDETFIIQNHASGSSWHWLPPWHYQYHSSQLLLILSAGYIEVPGIWIAWWQSIPMQSMQPALCIEDGTKVMGESMFPTRMCETNPLCFTASYLCNKSRHIQQKSCLVRLQPHKCILTTSQSLGYNKPDQPML
jgi:hypothetical protein